MPVIAVIGAYVGAAVATAAGFVGTAVTIGAALGAGLLSGIYAVTQGGEFGKGFAIGAVSSFAGGALGGVAEGAASTMAEMGAAEIGGIAGDVALEGITSGAGTAAGEAMGEIGGFTGGLEDAAFGGLGGADQYAANAVGGNTGLESMYNADVGSSPAGINAPQSNLGSVLEQSQTASTPTSYGAEPSTGLGLDTYTGTQTPTNTYDMGMTAPQELSALEGSSLGQPGQPVVEGASGQSQPTGNAFDTEVGYDGYTGRPTAVEGASTGQSTGGLKGMYNSANTWLQDNLGFGADKAAKGLGSLYDIYEGRKQAGAIENQANAMRQQYSQYLNPMSRDAYIGANVNPQDYLRASQRMARAGRTGTLPILLANMRAQASQDYTNKYLPNANQQAFAAQNKLMDYDIAARAAKDKATSQGVGRLGSLFFG